ncbi:hypothetical protein CCOS865_01829 [Pseudomonas reidholzensis]|uniref:Uncharacterized protein n=1 Tax=Pseudomonas reidholzensis TaxID=1785162 RepID=A0A383RRS3_9PSED|nr:hypothetical protein [Pseudomonas reidholzensis]SYX89575.1 hypothetical protein CCOS865_01829 [Pseudomonas reidholzensis]
MSTKKNDAAQSAPATVIYCDKLNASRSLFMANGRELKVLRARLEIGADDIEAMAYLDARSDIERLEA